MLPDEYTPLRNYIARFLNVTEAEWSAHRNELTRRFLRKGEFLVQAGQVCHYVSFINRGSFRMYREVNDQEATKNFFFESEYASEYESFLTRRPSIYSIRALEDAEVMELNYPKMQLLYEQFPVWQKFGRLMAEGLFLEVVERSYELQHQTPEERYIKLLEAKSPIFERIPLHHIASYLGIQPESLSRIRKRISENQLK